MSALIDGDSVTTVDGITDSSGNAISLEQFAAQQAGFTVTVVTGAQWDAMTAADFAAYQVLIVGDPHCVGDATSATSDASVWAPVVIGTSGLNPAAGNRTLVGAAPEFNYLAGGGAPTTPGDPTTAGTEHLVQDGIAYAGQASGATGVYLDTGCTGNGIDASVLNSLSSAGTGFIEDTSPPCGGARMITGSFTAFGSVTDANIQWACSDNFTFPAYPTDWDAVAVTTDAPRLNACGVDQYTGDHECGEPYLLVAGPGAPGMPRLTLTPFAGSDPAGGTHTITATLTARGSPMSSYVVGFQLTGQNAGAAATCVPASCETDANGTVTFTYPDTNGAGTDTIKADANLGQAQAYYYMAYTATQTWTINPTTMAASLSSGGQSGTSITVPAGTAVADTATLTGADAATAGGTVTYQAYYDPACTVPAGSGSTKTVAGGVVPASDPVTLSSPGTYYWTAGYSGDSGNAPSASSCGVQTETVTGPGHAAPAVDNSRTASGTTSATSTGLNTTQPGDLLVAYATADAPTTATQSVTVSGLGLTWTRVAQANAEPGDAEVWTATAPGLISNGMVSAKANIRGYHIYLTVVAYTGATGIGAAGTFAAASGAPTGSVTTTQDHSWVWGAGFDWSAAVNHTPGTGQTMFHQTKDGQVGNTSWVQSLTAATPAPGTAVTINDTAPTGDMYDLVVVEIL